MSSFNERSKAEINQEVAIHTDSINSLKKGFPIKLASYKKAVEDLKKSYDKFNNAMRRFEINQNEKNEILLAGAEKSLVRCILASDEYAKGVNSALDEIDGHYSEIINLLVEVDAKAATKYAASRRNFMERAAMDMDEAHQLIANMPIPTVDAETGSIVSFSDPKPNPKSNKDKSWEAHELNSELNMAKMYVKECMGHYKSIVRDFERTAIEFAKAKKKYGGSTSAKSKVFFDEAKDKYLVAVESHNKSANRINDAISKVLDCYEKLKAALANVNRRSLIKVAAEQDEYYEKLMNEIKKLRAPIVNLGIKNAE
jgi:predicted translin family RNA/ssDNA-binding protein